MQTGAKYCYHCFALLLTFLFSPVAGAALLNGTSSSGGTVVDTTNNLEWLDLSLTSGLSPNAAVTTYGSDGWQWATAGQVSQLLDEFFTQNPPDVPAARPSPDLNATFSVTSGQTDAWQDLFGGFTNSISGGYYNDEVIDNNQEQLFWFSFSDSLDFSPNNGGDFNNVNAEGGVFLVRESSVSAAPEPTSMALLGGVAGLSLLGSVRRENQSKD